MKNYVTVSGLAAIILTSTPAQSLVNFDGSLAHVSGSCMYKGLTIELYCDNVSDSCKINKITDPSGREVSDMPINICMPLAVVDYYEGGVLYCIANPFCDKTEPHS